jgi:hypothetical protein
VFLIADANRRVRMRRDKTVLFSGGYLTQGLTREVLVSPTFSLLPSSVLRVRHAKCQLQLFAISRRMVSLLPMGRLGCGLIAFEGHLY